MPLRQWLFIVVMAIVVVAILGKERLSPPATPPNNTNHQNAVSDRADHKGDNNRPSEAWWEPLVEDRVAFATLILAGLTGALAISTVVLCFVTARGINQQSRDMRDSIQIAERTLTDYERPWLIVSSAHINWRDTPTSNPTQGVYGTGVLNDWLITLRIKNIGRMPALIDTIEFKIESIMKMPIHPNYDRPSPLLFRRHLAANEEDKTGTVGPGPGAIGQLTFYGRILYRELNGREHATGFALDPAPYMPAYTVSPMEAYEYYT